MKNLAGTSDPVIGRGRFTLWGTLLFAVKHNLDRLVATHVFDREWSVFNYVIPPDSADGVSRLHGDLLLFYATLAALALPFVAIGTLLTVRRLRSLAWPVGLVALFFVPAVNLIFFLVLCLVPARSGTVHEPGRRTWMPRSEVGSAALAVALTVPVALLLVSVGIHVLAQYGWGLFVGIPYGLGLAAVLLYARSARRTLASCLAVAALSNVMLGALLLAAALEGAICLIMAAPLALPLALLGGFTGYAMRGVRERPEDPRPTLLGLAVAVPLLMGSEYGAAPQPLLLAVRTSVEIDAPPEAVWPHVVSFTPLPEPREWLFRAGIAYPQRATIRGHGKGAVRECVFSTGSFVEPITVWDAPRRLAFDVSAQPSPMAEWTPFADVAPPHLSGYLRSEGGEFLLEPLPGGRTRVQGTTWYRHALWPAPYWRLWSDAIIHRIHARVLAHVKARAERPALTLIRTPL